MAAEAAARVTISIDAAQVGEPISKYVYGQFIEHLGRCIYGGIWAEMLEDRKFFYPIGKGESPWKAVGAGDAVTMVREGAFVGEHSPRIALAGDRPRGIVQGGIGPGRGQDLRGADLARAEQGRCGPGEPRLGRRGRRPANDRRLRMPAASSPRRRWNSPPPRTRPTAGWKSPPRAKARSPSAP